MKIKITIICILILLAGLWCFQSLNKEQNPAHSKIATVTATVVKAEQIQTTIEAVGTANAEKSVTITANVTEYIKKLNFEDGAFVKQGVLLIQLEDTEEVAELQVALARYEVAKQFFQRTLKLSKQEYLSAQEHDTSIADMRSTKATVNVIKARIQDRKIFAPFAGFLGLSRVNEGALIEPSDPIVTLDKIDRLEVDFDIPESEFNEVHVGQKVELKSIAHPNKVFSGKVNYIDTRINPNTRAFTVRVYVENKNYRLRPGMLLQVKLRTQPRNAILLPEAAILSEGPQHFVYILEPDSKVKKQLVKIGQRQLGYIEILSGLKAGMKVVVDGGFKLNPGQKVKVIKTQETAS